LPITVENAIQFSTVTGRFYYLRLTALHFYMSMGFMLRDLQT